ncbi:MAG: hypothetical protein R2932_32550 [Caldilineaceae bacterium]
MWNGPKNKKFSDAVALKMHLQCANAKAGWMYFQTERIIQRGCFENAPAMCNAKAGWMHFQTERIIQCGCFENAPAMCNAKAGWMHFQTERIIQ